MKNTNQSELIRTMNKQALRTFGGLALVVYIFALSYCYFTGRLMETAIVAVVMLGLGILIFSLYYSTDKQSKTNTNVTTSKSSLRNRSIGVFSSTD